jgi:hypothetical protein
MRRPRDWRSGRAAETRGTRVRYVSWRLAVVGAIALCAGTALAARVDFSIKKYSVGPAPNSTAVGDFNRDGLPDLAVANFQGNGISILRGKDGGAFKAAVDYMTGGNPSAIAIGRFDPGKDEDLAVAANGAVSVLLGKRGAKFTHADSYGSYGTAITRGIATADLDDDGMADLAIANDANGGQLSVLFGIGPGVFGAQQNFPIGADPGEVQITKLNADAQPDVVVAGPNLSDEVSVLLGNGTPSTLDAAQPYAAGPGPSGIALGDFNGDGDKDLAVSDRAATPQNKNVVSVLPGDGLGGFGPAEEVILGDVVPKRGGAGANPIDVAAARLDGDDQLDLAVPLIFSNELATVFGKGDLAFSKAHRLIVGDGPNGVTAGRLDRGPSADLAVVLHGSAKVAVLLNQR